MSIDLDNPSPFDKSPANFRRDSACAPCGGQCCKSLPGQFFPSDLGEIVEERIARARELLATGLYSIDWWEDYNPIYHLRPATLAGVGRVFDGSWGGQCAMLGKDGCTLRRAERPTVCKALKPKTARNPFCTGLGKRDVAQAWVNDSAWLHDLGVEMQEAEE